MQSLHTDLLDHAATPPRGAGDGGPRGLCTAEAGNVRAPQSIAFTVPGQPQGKGRPRVGKVGAHARLFTPAKTVAYEGLVAHAAQVAMAGHDMLLGAVEVTMFIACQVPDSWSGKKQRLALEGGLFPTTKPDTDNTVKAIFDGCNGVAWKDDVQVVDLSLRKRYAATPGVRVVIRPVVVDQPGELW
jgi:Holliday junction resolvase RusA-like endonuclease